MYRKQIFQKHSAKYAKLVDLSTTLTLRYIIAHTLLYVGFSLRTPFFLKIVSEEKEKREKQSYAFRSIYLDGPVNDER